MYFKEYTYPNKVGYKGRVENSRGVCVGFVNLEGKIQFEW